MHGMKRPQGIAMPVFKTEQTIRFAKQEKQSLFYAVGKKLDIGCGHNRLKGAFGVAKNPIYFYFE